MSVKSFMSAAAIAAVTGLAATSALAQITIPTVVIGNPGNAADPLTGNVRGSVAYTYSIGATEVTNAQYAAFLNAKARTDTYSLYNTNMAGSFGGILRSGAAGSYSYSTVSNRANYPVNFVSFWDACRFANWLHNGQGSGDTETGAYTLGGVTSPVNASVTRNPDWRWAVTSQDEWYKAAYHQPASAGGDSDNYWLYPTSSNSVPSTAQANYLGSNTTPVGSFAANYYGTFDMGGNVWEWNELIFSVNRGSRGGACVSTSDFDLRTTFSWGFGVNIELNSSGFRVSFLRPFNDACANAIDISLATSTGLTLQGTLIGASSDGAAPCGNSAGNGDVWYRFTSAACSPGRLRVTTCGSHDANGFDTVLSLHNNCGEASFVCIDDGSQAGVANCGAQDAGTPRDAVLETVVVPGQTVYVRVSNYGTTLANTFLFNAFFTTPSNDACANAVAVTDGTYNFCTTGATTDPTTGGPTESFCSGFGDANIGNDVWYSYVAPCDGLTSVSLCGSSFDTKLGAYAGSCPSVPNTVITCNDDFCSVQSQISFAATAGQRYLIRIGGFSLNGSTANGDVTMTIGTECGTYCPADFNQDGGVDGADVDAFFAAWEAGEASADVNQDGGVDGSDINVFFAAWEAGGC